MLDGLGNTQQLQSVDDLNIPLRARVDQLETQFKQLAEILAAQGLEVPEEFL